MLFLHCLAIWNNMGWLTKIFRGSTHNISEGQDQSRQAEGMRWNEPSSSALVTDVVSEFDNDDIDRAIALALSEEEHKKSKGTGKDLHLDEVARAIQESLNVESPPRARENGSPPRAREVARTLVLVKTAVPMAAVHFNSYHLCFLLDSGHVLDVTVRLAMGVSLVAWGLFGIPNVFAAMLVINQFMTMSFPCREIIHTIKHAIRSTFTQSVMSASNLFLQI